MEPDNSDLCAVCCQKPNNNEMVKLKCQHPFCIKCLKEYITVLKVNRQLTPQKLRCVHEGCDEDIDDATILAMFPGE